MVRQITEKFLILIKIGDQTRKWLTSPTECLDAD